MQKFQALPNLLNNAAGNETFSLREIQSRKKRHRLRDWQRHNSGDRLIGHFDGQAFRLQAGAPASRTWLGHHEAGEILGDRAVLIVMRRKTIDDAFHLFAFFADAEEKGVLGFGSELFEWNGEINLKLLSDPADLQLEVDL